MNKLEIKILGVVLGYARELNITSFATIRYYDFEPAVKTVYASSYITINLEEGYLTYNSDEEQHDLLYILGLNYA